MKRGVKNQYIDCGNYYEIILEDRYGNERYRTKISKDELEKVRPHKWHYEAVYNTKYGGYAKTTAKIGLTWKQRKTLTIGDIILGKKQGCTVDHINHDPLDNRNENLRFATKRQQVMNRRVRGYFWNTRLQKWFATIKLHDKQIYLGVFTNEKDAKNARLKAQRELFGIFSSV